MSYRISSSIIGPLTLTTGCNYFITEEWQGIELQQTFCLDEPTSYYDYYNSYSYDCQNEEAYTFSLPIVQNYLYEEQMSLQYFLSFSKGIGTFIQQQSIQINNKEYRTSYFLQSKIQQTNENLLLEFGFYHMTCTSQEENLKCTLHNDSIITFEPSTTDLPIFNVE